MSVRSLMADPDFKRLSPERQRVMLRRVGATPGFVQDFQRQQIGNMGEENANRLAGPQARKDQTPIDISQVMGPGGRGGISRAAGGPSPEVGLAANVAGLALPGMVMNPIATGLAAGRGYVAEEASSRMGASKTASTTLGVLASIGPRAVLSGLSRLVGMGAKKGAQKLVATIFPKTELEALRASQALRAAGHTQTEINALIAPVAKVEQKAATTAVKAVAPKPVTPPKAPTKAAPVIPPKAPTKAATGEEPWRVVITHGKNKGQGGVKIKHGMGRGQTRPGGQSGPRHDVIRLDNGTEVTVPSTNVLTDFGKANHPSTIAAIKATRSGASAKVIAGLKEPLTKEEHAIVMRLQGFMKTGVNKASIKEIAKNSFGDNFGPVWKFITSPQTRI